jgi:hypothetical protein
MGKEGKGKRACMTFEVGKLGEKEMEQFSMRMQGVFTPYRSGKINLNVF